MSTTQYGLQHTHTSTEHVDIRIASHILLLSKLDLLTPLQWSVGGLSPIVPTILPFGPALTSERVSQEYFIPWDGNDMGGLTIRGNHSNGPFCAALGKSQLFR